MLMSSFPKMAALIKLFSSRTFSANICLNSCSVVRNSVNENFVCSTIALTNYVQQSRGKNSTKARRQTSAPIWWVKRRAKFVDQHLTADNRDFVEEVIEKKFEMVSQSPLKEPPWPRGEWNARSRRTGVIAKKIGIYPMWKKDGTRLLTTLLQVVDNHVIRYISPDAYGESPRGRIFKGKYGCLVVGAESEDPQLFTPEYCGLFEEAGVMPKRKLTRFTITADAAIQPGTPLTAMHFRVGDYVDCCGKTVEHGFQGVMKKWGMRGGPASHGTTKAHRRVGSIGTGRQMSRVWPGKKMPGHMGSEWRTCRGLKIWRINTKYNVLWIQGPAVPGSVNGYVYIMDTAIPPKKPQIAPPFPTFYPDAATEAISEELNDPELHSFADPTLMFENEPEIVVPIATGKKLAKTASKGKR